MKFWKENCPYILAGLIAIIMVWSGIDPTDRFTWWAEILPAIVLLGILVGMFRKVRFSNTACLFAAIGLILHTIGSHYTFAQVPFDWFSEIIGAERNHYDRIGHFSAGLYAFPIAEYVQRTKFITYKPAIYLFSIFSIMSFAAIYEIIEWWYAEIFGGQQASDFLGSQGDIWDAQKDILADTLGAVTALFFYPWKKWEKIRGFF